MMEKEVISLISTVKPVSSISRLSNPTKEVEVVSLITPRHKRRKIPDSFEDNVNLLDDEIIEIEPEKIEPKDATTTILTSLFGNNVNNSSCVSKSKPVIEEKECEMEVEMSKENQVKRKTKKPIRKKTNITIFTDKMVSKQMMCARKINEGKFAHLSIEIEANVSEWFKHLQTKLFNEILCELKFKKENLTLKEKVNQSVCSFIFKRKQFDWLDENKTRVNLQPLRKNPIIDESTESLFEPVVFLFFDPNNFLLKLQLDKLEQTGTSPRVFKNLVDTLKLTLDVLNVRNVKKILILSGIFELMSKCEVHSISRTYVNEALTYLLMRFGIDTIVTTNTKETIKRVVEIVKSVGRRPYLRYKTKVEVGRRIKNRNLIEAELRGLTEEQKRKEVWINHLRCFSKVTEARARQISEIFPTFNSLYDILQATDESLKQKIVLDKLVHLKPRPIKISSLLVEHFR